MPRILDGAAIAAAIKQEVAEEVKLLAAQGIRPGLAAVLVGNVAASEIYVRSKVQTCAELGIFSDLITPPETVTTEEMLDLVASLNARDEIDGILIQLPLPAQVDAKALLDAVSPAKDVDGFHPVTRAACKPAVRRWRPARRPESLRFSSAAKFPSAASTRWSWAAAILSANRRPCCCSTRTPLSPSATRRPATSARSRARPTFWWPPSAAPASSPRRWSSPARRIIDVGINRITNREEFDRFFAGNAKREAAFAKRGSTIVGDVHPKAFELAGAYTPVPGGVGPLTIAMLMANTVRAAKMRRGA